MCSPALVRRYRNRISGALADRIDISLLVEQPAADSLSSEAGESSAAVRARVVAARKLALVRQGCMNAELSPAAIRRQARMTTAAKAALVAGHTRMGLSGRGHDRVLRVARTLADLHGEPGIDESHIAGALAYRRRGGE